MAPPDPLHPPRVFVTYSHDSPAHMDRVLALCDHLRHRGVDANLDQYEPAPPEGWPRWTVRQIESAEYVLVVCTEIYRRRFDGTEEKGRGLGVKWEGAVLSQLMYISDSETGKVVPVVFTPEDVKHIPTVLGGGTRYDLGGDEGYEQLYRHLTQQPAVRKPDLGPMVPLPPKPRASVFPEVRAKLGEGDGVQAAPVVFRNARRPAPWRHRWAWLLGAVLLIAISALARYLSFAPAPKIGPTTSQGPAPPPLAKQLLQGQILDDQTGNPLSGVQVMVPELDLLQTTDRLGKYRFEVSVTPGRQLKLRAFLAGYEPINADPPAGTDFLNVHHMRRNR
ncbi:MAG: TIR domain-containing protein [Acidobacteriota bacterium]|nr:TIR domain-containing protein [Acidobacteriota bacterium]